MRTLSDGTAICERSDLPERIAAEDLVMGTAYGQDVIDALLGSPMPRQQAMDHRDIQIAVPNDIMVRAVVIVNGSALISVRFLPVHVCRPRRSGLPPPAYESKASRYIETIWRRT